MSKLVKISLIVFGVLLLAALVFWLLKKKKKAVLEPEAEMTDEELEEALMAEEEAGDCGCAEKKN